MKRFQIEIKNISGDGEAARFIVRDHGLVIATVGFGSYHEAASFEAAWRDGFAIGQAFPNAGLQEK